jgi:hypothetical protein
MKCSCCDDYAEDENMVWLEYEKTHICLKCHNAFLAFMQSFRAMDKQAVRPSEKREEEL